MMQKHFVRNAAKTGYQLFACNVLKLSGVCFRITYSMTNQSLFSTFKRNISLIKNLAYPAVNNVSCVPDEERLSKTRYSTLFRRKKRLMLL